MPPRRQAAARRGRGARLEMAVHLPGVRHRHGQRAGGAGGPADRVPHHRVIGDELLLHSRACRADLRDAGMETQAARVINQPGVYEGFSANYSGAGFSGMRFEFHGLEQCRLRRLGRSRQARTARRLTATPICKLERPSESEPVRRYASVDADLFRRDPQHVRRAGQDVHERNDGHRREGRRGLAAAKTLLPLQYDKYARRGAVLGPSCYVPASARRTSRWASRRRTTLPSPCAMPRD